MFKDKAFNISILISTAWHLFWIFAVIVVVTPTVQPRDVYQEVDFLGPILEKTAFDIMVENVSPQSETLYARSALFVNNIYLRPRGPERKILNGVMEEPIVEKLSVILQRYGRDDKEIPTYFSEEIRMIYERSITKTLPLSIEGPAKRREIMYKPDKPSVLRGLYDDSNEYLVKLKFFLSEDGLVRDVEPVISSGYPDIDLEGIKFLKRWRFSPSSQEEDTGEIWGIVTVKIKAQ